MAEPTSCSLCLCRRQDAHLPYAQSYGSHAVIPPPTPSLARTSHASSSADVAMPTYRGPHATPATATPPAAAVPDVRMQTVGRGAPAEIDDVRMMTMRADVGQPGLRAWERELIDSPEMRRKATVAQLYFLDYYCESPAASLRLCARALDRRRLTTDCARRTSPFLPSVDLLGYIHTRSIRQASFKASTSERALDRDGPEYRKELRSYLGRERVLLRKRRTKLKVDQFRIIAQVRPASCSFLLVLPRLGETEADTLDCPHSRSRRSAKVATARSTSLARPTRARSARSRR